MATFTPPPGVTQTEASYQGQYGKMPPRYDTSQLRRTGPNSFVDSLGQQYDGKGRPMALGGSRPWQQGGGGGAGGGAHNSNPFAGSNWQNFDPNKAPPIPGASQVGQTYLSAVDAYKRALAQFSQQRQGLMTQYGYTSDVDPTSGVMKNTRVDPNNPYGEYQLNRRSNYMDYLGAEQNRMERGLGRKGLGSQLLGDMRFNWGGKDSATSRSLIDSMSGIDQNQQEAYANMTNSYWEALLSAAQSGIEGGDFGYPEEDYSDIAGPDEPGGGPQGKERTIYGKDYGLGYYRDKNNRLTYKAPARRPVRAAGKNTGRGVYRGKNNQLTYKGQTAKQKAARARAAAWQRKRAAANKAKRGR
jgi:hypothetical protein